MKVRYKITAAFMLLTIIVLAALCSLIYFITAGQQKTDFDRRLHNRALTVGTILSRLPVNEYQVLSKFDSSTTNLLGNETIHVYDSSNHILYQFAKNYADTFAVDLQLLNDARSKSYLTSSSKNRQLVAIYYPHAVTPMVVVTSAVDENGKRNLFALEQTLLTAFIAGILFSFLAGWLFSRQLLLPIRNIATTVNTISANNIESRLAEPSVNDEWKILAVTFNNLLRRLQDSFEIQGRFISNASHELSTPLTAVINQIDVALQKNRHGEEYLSVLQSVRGDIEHMAALTQQLLDMARTARGGSLQTVPVRIDEIIMELPALLKNFSNEYIVLVFFDELPDDEKLSTVNGNPELLLSAFRNIAENACKYAPDHTVNISLSFAGNRIVVLFTNHHGYFNPDEIESIFQPFQRGSNAFKAAGHGLGLSLTRRIILLHNGEIKAEIIDGDIMLVSVILPSSF